MNIIHELRLQNFLILTKYLEFHLYQHLPKFSKIISVSKHLLRLFSIAKNLQKNIRQLGGKDINIAVPYLMCSFNHTVRHAS